LKLKDILDGVEYETEKPYSDISDIEIEGIAYNSTKVRPNYVFVAIEGFKTDGHRYIDSAVSNGAKVVILQNDSTKLPPEVVKIKVGNSREVLAKLASNFYDNPSSKLNLIGITGTNGKTTTTYLTKAIFEKVGHKTGIIGTIGNLIGSQLVDTNTTTPESLELQESFCSMLDNNVDTAVMEVSSHALDLNRVDHADFKIGVFTNLSVDHLDYHKTIDNYLSAKKKLFYKTSDCNVINGDDEYGQKIIDEIKSLPTHLLTYGIESDEFDLYATDIDLKSEGVSYTMHTPIGDISLSLNIPGLFSVYNSLAAASIAYAAAYSDRIKITLEDIKEGLESVSGVNGRFEVVPIGKDFSVIIDFAHTPDALEKVLKSIQEFSEGRVVAVFGAGGDRDSSKRAPMGEIGGKYADLSIITSDNPRTEDPEKIISDVLEGVKKTNGDYITIVDRKEAIEYAIKNALPGDIILLAGKGHETYIILGETKYHFDEREIVKNALL
jgi:UDP-N-acetylmuramoyl-L-alanyl-D-glutamate--2,6-diaminopimelate ligase